MTTTRIAIVPLLASTTLVLLSLVGSARAGTLEQAVESARRGNTERVEEEIRKVQVGRHGFTVEGFKVEKNGDTVVATGRLFHRQSHAKSDLLYYTITVSRDAEPDIAITSIVYRHWINKLINQALAKGFKFILSKTGPQGVVLAEAGATAVDKAHLYSYLQANWEGASKTVLAAIATKMQAELGNGG